MNGQKVRNYKIASSDKKHNYSHEISRLTKTVARLNKIVKEKDQEMAERGKDIMTLEKILQAWENQLPEIYCMNIDEVFKRFNLRNPETKTKIQNAKR